MSCGCNRPHNCGCPTPPVLTLCNGEKPVLFHTMVIPASMGDDITGSKLPENGAYRNMLIKYEANDAVYLYNSDGIYTQLSQGAAYPVGAVYTSTVSTVPTISGSWRPLGSLVVGEATVYYYERTA